METKRGEEIGGKLGPTVPDAVTDMSLGSRLNKNQVWSTDSAQYHMYTENLDKALREIADRESERKNAAKTIVITIGLNTDQLTSLAELFPEYKVHLVPTSNPVHALWTAVRRLGNIWMADMLDPYASSVVHLGGNVFDHIQCGRASVHLEVDALSTVAANEVHEAATNTCRFFSKAATVQTMLGRPINASLYREFLHTEKWQVCTLGANCGHKADGHIFDLTLTPLAPAQVCAAMAQAGTHVAYVMLPYHPVVLAADTGELPGVGVHFRKTAESIIFEYPEGVAGVTKFPLRSYAAWLVQHAIPFGRSGRVHYHIELNKVGGPVLFARVVRVEGVAEKIPALHALELPGDGDTVLVKGWVLKDLSRDPQRQDSWEEIAVPASHRVIQRAREHALSLPKEEFNAYAIRKRLEVANDRFVVQGTSVTVNPVLANKRLTLLRTLLYAETFVTRFETGQLARELMTNLSALVEFTSASTSDKVWAIFRATVTGVWRHTLGPAVAWIRKGLDFLRKALGRVPSERLVTFGRPPSYVLIHSGASDWRKATGNVWFDMVKSLYIGVDVCGASVGALVTPAFSTVHTGGSDAATAGEFSAHVLTSCHTMTDFESTLPTTEGVPVRESLLKQVRQYSEMTVAPVARHTVEMMSTASVDLGEVERPHYQLDPDYIGTMNRVHEAACPGVAGHEYAYDTFSISLDSQDRTLATPYLKGPIILNDLPKVKSYFNSKIQSYNVPKRQNTIQETLSAVAARNMSAPVLALPQNHGKLANEVWGVFLDTMCRPDARDMLKNYQENPVNLDEQSVREWMEKAKPDALSQMRQSIEVCAQALEEMPVHEYIAMIKSDVKPPVSDKPIGSRIEPQVIVYHQKALSGLYSSILRVLVRRFLSLLNPNILVNFLKDMEGVEQHVNAHHAWEETLKYLENDFSKYDKSQLEFAHFLKAFIYEQLGMNQEFLDRWVGGHVRSVVRVIGLGLTFHVDFQQKSGDASTAFGNGIVNIVSVAYAYRGTLIVWAVIQGDDSLVCAKVIAREDLAARTMAEVFNLQAKMYVTDAPYFASNFFLIDGPAKRIKVVPDPVKRIEKWSMGISAEDPQWSERFISHSHACAAYMHTMNTYRLETALKQRYVMAEGVNVMGIADAIATAVSTEARFRGMWEEKPTKLHG